MVKMRYVTNVVEQSRRRCRTCPTGHRLIGCPTTWPAGSISFPVSLHVAGVVYDW